MNYLALTTVVFAVCATLSTRKGGAFSTRAVVSQSQASDLRAYYQAKSIKGYVYELQREKFEMDLKAGKGMARGLAGDYEERIGAHTSFTPNGTRSSTCAGTPPSSRSMCSS